MLYYYILCDSLIANNELYEKYANLVLNDTRYMSDITILQHIKKNNQINIPFNVFANASKYINMPPLILYYLVARKYIFQHTNEYFLNSIRTFCFNEIHENIKNNYKGNDWNIIDNLLDNYLDNFKVNNILIVDKDMIRILKHNYQNTNIECSLSDKIIEKIEFFIAYPNILKEMRIRAEKLTKEVLDLPYYYNMTEKEQSRVINALKSIEAENDES